MQRVTVQTRQQPGAPFQTIGTLKTDGRRGYLDGSVTVRRSGVVRLTWTGAGGTRWVSRSVAFTVKAPAKR